MADRLQVLILEDRAADAEIMAKELTKAGFDVDWQRVDTERDFRLRLTPRLGLVLADYQIPGFGALPAMQALAESKLDIPLLVVAGSVGDEKAAECLKMGAKDYVLKDRMARLGPAVRRALEERRTRLERTAAQDALRRNEEQMRGILSTIDDVVSSVSLPDWTLRYLNPAAEKLYGRPVAAFFERPQLWLECVHPEDRAKATAAQEAALQWGTSDNEYRIVRPGGTVRFVSARLWVAYGPDGKPSRIEGIVTDSTERKEAEGRKLALEKSQREAERLAQLNEWKSQFINTIAHELNNPLTPMKIQLALLRKGQDPGFTEAQRKSIAILGRGVDRLGAFLQDLLEATRLQSGALKLDVSEGDLEPVVRAALQDSEPQAHEAGVDVAARLASPLLVASDKRRIAQVLANLMSNAIKFTPKGGKVTVDAKQEAGNIVLTVTDTGRGIEPDEIPNLFKPFSQLPGATQAKHTGTGLGLFICKGIVEHHGGRIWCASEGPGKGSTFGFSIPVKPEAA